MTPVSRVDQVFEAMQQAKTGASAYCTNFFPVQARLQDWVARGELLSHRQNGSVLFLRKDRDFWHLSFCAENPESLQRALAALSSVKTNRVVVDLVGSTAAVASLAATLEAAGFCPYTRLQRLVRLSSAGLLPVAAESPAVAYAQPAECPAIVQLLDACFDKYACQLPTAEELHQAVLNRQILVVKCEGQLAALLFFETQGFSSTLRYWAVAKAFRSRRLGAGLMRQYFSDQSPVRRFLLWVEADNQNVIEKYQHYGYAPDGLLDLVFINDLIIS